MSSGVLRHDGLPETSSLGIKTLCLCGRTEMASKEFNTEELITISFWAVVETVVECNSCVGNCVVFVPKSLFSPLCILLFKI